MAVPRGDEEPGARVFSICQASIWEKAHRGSSRGYKVQQKESRKGYLAGKVGFKWEIGGHGDALEQVLSCILYKKKVILTSVVRTYLCACLLTEGAAQLRYLICK